MTPLPILPPCFGTHEESHPDCDGDPDAEDALFRKPCAVRGACRDGEGAPGQVVGVLPARVKRALPPRSRPPARAFSVYEHFKERLSAEAGMPWAAPGQAPLPGQLFESEHVVTSSYVSVSARSAGDEPVIAVARVFFLSRQKKIAIAFPCDVVEARASMSAAAVKGVRLVSGSRPTGQPPSGYFACCTPYFDRGAAGACARLAAKILSRAGPRETRGGWRGPPKEAT